MSDTICDCGHDDQVHSETDPEYCETCGGKCRVGGFRTYQRQINELRRRIETTPTISPVRRAEIVQLAAAALTGLCHSSPKYANTGAAELTNLAVNLAVATQKRIDQLEGDGF